MKGDDQKIAIVGMACSLPGIDNPLEFMDFLSSDKSINRSFPQGRRQDLLPLVDDLYHHLKAEYLDLEYQRGGYLKSIDDFDPSYFKISPSEAEVMDPAQRLFLQQAIKAIEDAGYGPEMIRGSRTGIYLGYMPDYRPFNYKDLLFKKPEQNFDLQVSNNLPAVIASRTSYFLDLKGPALCVDTACSSVITAFDLAVCALQKGTITGALVGGIKLMLAPLIANGQRIAIESPNFESKPFDDAADGVGIGEGVGAIYIKPLSLARESNDFIYSIIESSGTNQDGRSLGLAAPNPKSQKEVILETWNKSSVSADEIRYIEAHGTGTALGDPIEIKALTEAFRKNTSKKQFCYLSSVKANLGHLYEASGIPSMIKASLSVCFQKKFPIKNFEVPNRSINFAQTPFYVGQKAEEWKDSKRYAGINSFGMSGTNAHVLISNDTHEHKHDSKVNDNSDLLVISAKCEESLIGIIKDYVKFLDRNFFALKDICHTSRIGRSHYKYRVAVMAKSHDEAKAHLNSILSKAPKIDGCYVGSGTNLLTKTAQDYVQGKNIKWSNYCAYEENKRVPIPTYHFKKQRCWISFDPEYLEQVRNKNKFHHHCAYKKYMELDECASLLPLSRSKSLALCCAAEDLASAKQSFLDAGFNILAAKSWSQSQKLVDLIQGTKEEIQVVWCGKSTEVVVHDLAQPRSLRLLAKALCRMPGMPRLTIASHSGCSLSKGDFVDPIQKMIHGLGISLVKETKINIRIIDRHKPKDFTALASFLRYENDSLFLVMDDNEVYKRVFTGLPLSPSARAEDCLKEDGVYVISGGLGGIGLCIAKHLVEQWSAKVILLSRTGKVRPSYQKKFLSTLSNPHVKICGGFLGSQKEWQKLFANIGDTYGAIQGIYHLAGVPSAHLMVNESEKDLNRVLDPKVFQTKNMLDALSFCGLKSSFVALFSSVASFFPAVGQSSYCMANSFLDGIAFHKNAGAAHVCSLAWVAWKDIGMALDAKTNVDTSFKAILSDDAIEQMHRMIAAKVNVGLIGQINYKMSQMVKDLAGYGYELGDDLTSRIENSQKTRNDTRALEDIEVKIMGLKEQSPHSLEMVAKIWCRHLGYKRLEIGARLYDDLGGDSIIASQIAQDIKSQFGHDLNISDIVDASLEEVACIIDKMNSLSRKETL